MTQFDNPNKASVLPTRFANVIGAVDETNECVQIEFLTALHGLSGEIRLQQEVLLALPRSAAIDLALKLQPLLVAYDNLNPSPAPNPKSEKRVSIQRVVE